jgi:MoaA/NifB/PqqE/SkfB family radical SAM enzyme
MAMTRDNYIVKFDRNLLKFFRGGAFKNRADLKTSRFLLTTWLDQQRAIRRRAGWARKGVQVPPLMIVSITDRCNLNCVGCYARTIHPEPEKEMDDKRLFELADEAEELGISIVMIAGGEPLLRPAFFELAWLHPHILFLVFTNGLLLTEANIALFDKMRNLIPVLSLEGPQMETDMRRGDGMYKIVEQRMESLKKRGLFFGTSLTLTSQNHDQITSISFQQRLNRLGSRVSIFVDYVPVKGGTESLVLTPEQKQSEPTWMRSLEKSLPVMFVALPGDEAEYGGCLAGGRGFIHINPQGHVEACPFAPFSDTDLASMSLKEALNSKLMKVIRENANKLTESKGGCTLWENRDWVLAQMDEVKTS